MSGAISSSLSPSRGALAELYRRAIPEELKARRQFGLRIGKMPYVKNSGWWTRDGWNSPSGWVSFEEAIQSLQRGEVRGADGITFFLKRAAEDERQILALDFDCCVDPETGDIIPWARGLIERLRPFYTEISISGTGIRAFCFGNLPTPKPHVAIDGPDSELSEEERERISAAKARVGRGEAVAVENIRPRLEIFASNKHATLSGQRLSEFCYPAEDQSQTLREIMEEAGIDDAGTENRARQIAEAIERHVRDRGWLSKKAPIRIADVIDISKFTPRGRGRELEGVHPVHGSATGKNLVIDPDRNIWCCFHNATPHGGGDAWALLAVVEGIISCEDTLKGALRGEVLERTLDAALQRGLISEEKHRELARTSGTGSGTGSGSGSSAGAGAGSKRLAAKDWMVKAALERAELWQDGRGVTYISIPLESGGVASYPIKSTPTRQWLTRLFHDEHGREPRKDDIAIAIDGLDARAAIRERYEPHFRIAEEDNRIYVDLGRADWKILEITAEGWRVVDRAPVRFVRRGMLHEIPEPKRGGSWEKVIELLRLNERESVILALSWMLQAVWPQGPYVHLVLEGEQGSGKSILAQMLKLITDPSDNLLRRPPRDEEDLFVAARSERILSFDNLSGIQDWLSDALCCLSTGATYSKRQKYTDWEEAAISIRIPCILNGIEAAPTRPDLLDRIVTLSLRPIPPSSRRSEAELIQAVEAYLPEIWGLLADAASAGLRNRDRAKEALRGRLPRMADFALWITACEEAMPWEAGEFLETYERNREESMTTLIEADILAAAVVELARQEAMREQIFEGTPSYLYDELMQVAGVDRTRPPRGWPVNPSWMMRRLKRLAPALRAHGVEIEEGKDSNKTRFVRIGLYYGSKSKNNHGDVSDVRRRHQDRYAETSETPETPFPPLRYASNKKEEESNNEKIAWKDRGKMPSLPSLTSPVADSDDVSCRLLPSPTVSQSSSRVDDSRESHDLDHPLACHRIRAALACGITDPMELSRVCGLPVCLVARYAEREPRIDAERAREVLTAIERSGGAGGETLQENAKEMREMQEMNPHPASSVDTSQAREKVATTPSTEPMGVDALISELHRRGELSMHDMVLVKELKRGDSVGKALFDVNTNLGWTLPETTRRLERLKALGVVEETADALGTRRWRLRA